jgi:GGDEF domain-containing protein
MQARSKSLEMKRFSAWGQTQPLNGDASDVPFAERCVTLLLEGAMLRAPEIDAASYREFRTNLNRLAMQIPDPGTPEDKLILLRMIAHEFENYHDASNKALRERMAGWRGLAVKMAQELLTRSGIDPASPNAALLIKEGAELTASDEIQNFRSKLEAMLRPHHGAAQGTPGAGFSSSVSSATDTLKSAIGTTVTHTVTTGLPGKEEAVERLREHIARGGRGFLVLFRLSCLDVIRQRFGSDAVQDSVVAVSNFLASSLHTGDTVFQWSNASLLAILPGRSSEQILAAELQRMVMSNRDTNVNIGGRLVMVRIPISFELTAIDQLQSADDLFNIPSLRSN